MTSRLLGAMTVMLVLSPAPCAIAQGAGPSADTLSWLAGCWERRSAATVTEESWTAPIRGTLFGVSRTTDSTRVRAVEYMEIQSRGDTIAYVATPSGQRRTEFLSLALAPDSVLFVNEAHDFPQRVGYRRAGSDSLLVFIDGTLNGDYRRMDFRFRRARCPG